MKTIELNQVAAMRNEDIRRYNADRQYTGNSVADQKIDYVTRLSDEEYMNLYNDVVERENRKSAAAKSKKSAISEARKATGKSKKAYRAEYDALMAEYKKSGSSEAKNAAKAIAKFAF